jgi:hypothetical protein
MTKRVHLPQFILWSWGDRANWSFGVVRWGRVYGSIGLHRSVHIGPLEIRLWAMKPADWERAKREWRY